MRRRALLAGIAGGFAGLAGCIDAGTASAGEDPPDSPDGTPSKSGSPTTRSTTAPDGTATPTGTATNTPPDADVTVESVHLQYGIVTPSSPDSIGIDFEETPFLAATVAVDGPLERDDFAVVADDREFGPTKPDRFYRTGWGDDRWYTVNHRGLVLFELASSAVEDLRLTWPGGERTIDGAAGDRLAAGPPEFSAALALPDTRAGVDAPPVNIDVTNEDDTPRRFLGALNRVGPLIAYTPVARVSELVPAGETRTIEVDDGWAGTPSPDAVGDGDPDVTYRLQYGGGEESASIRLVESEE